MFKKIMVPIDLAHVDKLGASLQAAADLANHYGATCTYVGVTAPAPSSVAHTPEEFAAKLDSFAQEQSKKHGHRADGHAMVSHDPTIDIDDTLLKAEGETDADLVVMATHVPGIAEMFLPNHGGHLATHSKISVFLVRSD